MNIKLLFFDVDGTLTDGRIYMGPNGEAMKAFDVKDGYAIKEILPQHHIIPVIITGRESSIVANRACELGITELYQGKHDKLSTVRDLKDKYEADKNECAYFGDDVLDIIGMEQCGIVGCPADAVDEVRRISNYICKNNGGHGAAREFIEWLVAQKRYKRA